MGKGVLKRKRKYDNETDKIVEINEERSENKSKIK